MSEEGKFRIGSYAGWRAEAAAAQACQHPCQSLGWGKHVLQVMPTEWRGEGRARRQARKPAVVASLVDLASELLVESERVSAGAVVPGQLDRIAQGPDPPSPEDFRARVGAGLPASALTPAFAHGAFDVRLQLARGPAHRIGLLARILRNEDVAPPFLVTDAGKRAVGGKKARITEFVAAEHAVACVIHGSDRSDGCCEHRCRQRKADRDPAHAFTEVLLVFILRFAPFGDENISRENRERRHEPEFLLAG